MYEDGNIVSHYPILLLDWHEWKAIALNFTHKSLFLCNCEDASSFSRLSVLRSTHKQPFVWLRSFSSLMAAIISLDNDPPHIKHPHSTPSCAMVREIESIFSSFFLHSACIFLLSCYSSISSDLKNCIPYRIENTTCQVDYVTREFYEKHALHMLEILTFLNILPENEEKVKYFHCRPTTWALMHVVIHS